MPSKVKGEQSKVYVGGLGEGADEMEIEQAFRTFGRLRHVWVARQPSGFAFVVFEDKRDAREAIRCLDGTLMNGRRVRVELSTGECRWSKWKVDPPIEKKGVTVRLRDLLGGSSRNSSSSRESTDKRGKRSRSFSSSSSSSSSSSRKSRSFRSRSSSSGSSDLLPLRRRTKSKNKVARWTSPRRSSSSSSTLTRSSQSRNSNESYVSDHSSKCGSRSSSRRKRRSESSSFYKSRSRSSSYVSRENSSLDESDGWKSEEGIRKEEHVLKTKTDEKWENLLSNKQNLKEKKLENLPGTTKTLSENDDERQSHCSSDNRFADEVDKESVEQKTKCLKIPPKKRLASSKDDEESKFGARKNSKFSVRQMEDTCNGL